MFEIIYSYQKEKGKELIKNAEKEGYVTVKTPSEKGIKIREKLKKLWLVFPNPLKKNSLKKNILLLRCGKNIRIDVLNAIIVGMHAHMFL